MILVFFLFNLKKKNIQVVLQSLTQMDDIGAQQKLMKMGSTLGEKDIGDIAVLYVQSK